MKQKFIFLSLFILGILYLTACSGLDEEAQKHDNNVSDNENINDNYSINVNADENIEVQTYVDFEKDYLIVYLTNNNSYNIASFDVEAVYYDKNNKKIDEDFTINHDFASGKIYVTKLDLPDIDGYGYIPERIELSVKVDQEFQEIVGSENLYNDKVITSYKKVDDDIEIAVSNNSGINLTDVEIVVLFLKNEKPIYAEEISVSLDIEESAIEIISIPEDWEASENLDENILIEYDEIKLVVNRATS